MTRPRLLLNMIVKNESARIERCLASVAPWIVGAAIVDTGSTDDTPAIFARWQVTADMPLDLESEPFVDFSQARNAALSVASKFASEWDYLLLVDADMELVVEDDDWLDGLAPALGGTLQRPEGIPRPGGPVGAGRLLQRHPGGLEYWNTRLLSRASLEAGARYVGVTHEYLSTPAPTVNLTGAWFRDHADGANRPGKLERDIALLQRAVAEDPADARSVYYWAQSERDLGNHEKAAELYKRRAAMGGWDEEVFSALLNLSRCLRCIGE